MMPFTSLVSQVNVIFQDVKCDIKKDCPLSWLLKFMEINHDTVLCARGTTLLCVPNICNIPLDANIRYMYMYPK